MTPPEIGSAADPFALAIRRVCARPEILTVLEIGSGCGSGSTAQIVSILAMRTDPVRLFCLEICPDNCSRLRELYGSLSWVTVAEAASVELRDLPAWESVADFYDRIPSALRRYPRPLVEQWFRDDLLHTGRARQGGIAALKREFAVETFDAVLIDGSEFAGPADLVQTYGARWLLLDDICTFKNWANFQRLSRDPAYELISVGLRVRNGYAVFRRISER
jgi:hypothetical protein